jgi:hypothetical protein
MLSRSARASAGSSTGVCPQVTTWRGPRTAPAGFTGTTWPVTSQSNRCRSAASRCLTPRRGQLARTGLDPGRDVHRLHGRDRRHADIGAPGQKFLRRSIVRPACVRVADVGREEFEESHRRTLAGGGDKRRQCGRVGQNELVHVLSSYGFPRLFSSSKPMRRGTSCTLGSATRRMLICDICWRSLTGRPSRF